MKQLQLYIVFALTVFVFTITVRAQEETRKAAELLIQGDLKGAIATLDKSIAKNKDLFAAYKLRAAIKRMTGDFAGALADYTSAIDIKADDAELYEQRAMMRLFTRQDSTLILKDLDAAIAYGRKVEKIYSTRAMIRRSLGDTEGAVLDYRAAIGLRPDFAQAYVGLASIYSMNGDDDNAVQVLESFIELVENPGGKTPKLKGEAVVSNSVEIPTIADDKNKVTESTMLIKGSGTTNPTMTADELNKRTEKLENTKNTAAAYASLAAIYERRKDYEKASILVEKALKIDAQEFPAYETRGKIKSATGDYSGAISDFDAALKLMPKMPNSYLERGIAKLMLGKEPEAQNDFDKFLQLMPNGKAYLERRIDEARQKLAK